MEYIVSRDDAKKRLDIYLKEKNEKGGKEWKIMMF